MQQIILIFHVLFAIALIVLVLLQQGKGATMGASFGAGASQTVFGSQGSSSFLVKLTFIIAAVFFATSLVLNYLTAHQAQTNNQNNLLNAAMQISESQQQNANTTTNNSSPAVVQTTSVNSAQSTASKNGITQK